MHAQQHTPTHTHTDCFLSLEADYISDIAFAIIRFSGNEVSTADGMVLVCIWVCMLARLEIGDIWVCA